MVRYGVRPIHLASALSNGLSCFSWYELRVLVCHKITQSYSNVFGLTMYETWLMVSWLSNTLAQIVHNPRKPLGSINTGKKNLDPPDVKGIVQDFGNETVYLLIKIQRNWWIPFVCICVQYEGIYSHCAKLLSIGLLDYSKWMQVHKNAIHKFTLRK